MAAFARGGFATETTSTLYSELSTLAFDSGAAESKGDASVLVLSDDNFEHLTQASSGATTGPWFVKFYAPWCGHCKKMAPQWEQLAHTLKGRVNVAEVDCTQSRVTCKRFEVGGYPAIKLIDQGKVWSYSNARSAGKMQRWLETGRFADGAAQPEAVPPAASVWDTVLAAGVLVAQGLVTLYSSHFMAAVVLAGIAFVAGLFTMMIIVVLTEAPRRSTDTLPEEPLSSSTSQQEVEAKKSQ
jgi:protein disulfide-isomerase-like protein